jgi:thiamine-phosphate pyrophosphorylase
MFSCRIYPIIDTLGQPQRSHLEIARAVLAAGVPLLQLRVKDQPTGSFVELAREVKKLADASRASLIINDRADIAKLVGAAGVHLGQDDLAPAAARALLGAGAIIGFSTHSLAQAEAAAASGFVDYIGFGPIFATASKQNPDPVVGIGGLREVRSRVRLPLVAIGGITAEAIAPVLAAGADAVAMIGEIVRAPEIAAHLRRLLTDLDASTRA